MMMVWVWVLLLENHWFKPSSIWVLFYEAEPNLNLHSKVRASHSRNMITIFVQEWTVSKGATYCPPGTREIKGLEGRAKP